MAAQDVCSFDNNHVVRFVWRGGTREMDFFDTVLFVNNFRDSVIISFYAEHSMFCGRGLDEHDK